MLQKLALVFGVVFIAIGILGFVPGITTNGHLLGIFEVGLLHNLVHLLSGVAALAASASTKYARLYFQIFGSVYAVVTLIGFMMGSILGLFSVNLADNLLHLAIAATTLYLGFGYRDRAVANA